MEFIYVLLLCLTALTVVILVTVVGIVMVIALLTVPAAVAGLFTRNLGQNILLAIVLSVAFTVFGLALSYTPDLPAGATIILLAGGEPTCWPRWARASSDPTGNEPRPRS